MLLHTDFHKAFDAGRTFEHPSGPITLDVERLGALQITSGSIGVCDPYSLPGLLPLTRPVPSGIHPVIGGIATHPDGSRTLAACRLLVGDEPPVRWVQARSRTWPGSPEPDEAIGFDTDCAMLCLADPVAGPVPDFEEVFEILDADPPPLAAPLRGSRDATPWLAVSSGRGDGTYAAWWGLDVEGNPTTLELDFQVLWRDRELLASVPIRPLDPGLVEHSDIQGAGSALEVVLGHWPGFDMGIRLRGPGADPHLVGADGKPLRVHRTQQRTSGCRTWVFTSASALPRVVELRLRLGSRREPI